MGVTKKPTPKGKGKLKLSPSVEDAKNFDDFLETLDDSESDSGSENEEEDDSDDEEMPINGNGNGVGKAVNGKSKRSLPIEDEEDNDDEDDSDVEDEEEVEEEEEEEEEDVEDEEGDLGDDDEDVEEEEEMEVVEEPEIVRQGSEDADDVEGSDEEEGSGSEDEEGDQEMTMAGHKKALQRIQESDPDFFEYLKENDAELLNFGDSEDDSKSEDEETEGPIHKPPEELEEASDSEAEEERIDVDAEGYRGKVDKLVAKGVVNLEVIKDWEMKLSTTREIGVFVNVVEAFQCAVHQILQDDVSSNQKWKVDGSSNFNALVRVCIKHVKGFCVRYLSGSNNVSASEQKFDHRPLEFKDKCSQRWSKLRSKLKSYMTTLVKFLKSMGNSDAVASILRHCQKMSGFWALLSTKSYKLIRTLVNIWSGGEDSCRILAFLAIIKVANYNREVFLLRVYKQMYLAYVANCKFTSVNTWPAINLMRSSLTEIYLLDPALTYSVAFPFIRQLAIHLRNALTAGTTTASQSKQTKKEASRIVYSWQFVHSLNLWADVLAHATSAHEDNLKLLIYPVVQICLGTVKLIPTKKYIPLRFLIVRMLIKLQEKTGVFIPILPLITEVLLMTDFSMKSISKFSVRPLDMTCCLKADASESGYGKSVSENVFELLLRTCKGIATDLSFPEIVTPMVMQLRSFLKKSCKNPEVCRKYKTLLEKIDANSKYISEKRTKGMEAGTLSLSDVESQKILRVQMETSKPHPPILNFANEYLKVNARVQAKQRKVGTETREEKLIPKPSGPSSSGTTNSKSKKKLLDSDEDDSDTDFKTKFDTEPDERNTEVSPKKLKKKLKKRKLETAESPEKLKGKKKSKKVKMVVEFEPDDEVVDFELSD